MPNERVIVVDDDQDVLQALELSLKTAGIPVLTADNSEDALTTFEQNQCDILVVDFLLGKGTGIELVERVRRLRPRTKAILISGYIDHSRLSEDELLGELRAQAGCDYYFRKPFSNEELVTAIRACAEELDGRPGEWKAKAEQYLQGARISTDEIRNLNDKIKSNLTSLDERE